jgi:hypothetical protein
LEGLGVRYEYNITIDPKEVGSAVVDQINLAEDSDTWWAVVNVVMDIGFHKIWRISSLAEGLKLSV